jgi:predicted GNAT family acetyltransferase
MVDVRLRDEGLLLWDDEKPVSMIGLNPPVAGVVRIGPVYTPPPLRRRGYAGSAVAAVTRRALAGGVRRCMLYTDLANPTSNKIYAEVGYRRCGDWEEIALVRDHVDHAGA